MLFKERKLPKYGSSEWKRLEAMQALKVAQDVSNYQQAAPDAVLAVRFGKEAGILEKLGSIQGQQEYFGQPLSQMKYAAEGGEIEDMNMPEGEMSLLMPDPEPYLEEEGVAEDSTEGYLDGLRDILGEEDYMMLESAMADYPVVETVARMAIASKDNDGEGEIDGLGGPKDDMVPARLSPGEFVFSKEAVDVIGVGTLEEMHEQAKEEAALTSI